MAEPQGHAVGRVCEEYVDGGVFLNVNVEPFCADFVGHLVVENLEAGRCVLADVLHGVAKVVVALEHGHFVCTVGNILLHGLCIKRDGQECRKILFVGIVCGIVAGFGEFWHRNFCHGEKRPQLVVAAGHADLLDAGNGVHYFSSIQS